MTLEEASKIVSKTEEDFKEIQMLDEKLKEELRKAITEKNSTKVVEALKDFLFTLGFVEAGQMMNEILRA